jgi:tetratricopeptide (TPR) repeat protein
MTDPFSQILDGQLVIFCGAGISFAPPSNAPLWRPMQEFILEAAVERVVKMGAAWSQPYPRLMCDFVKHPALARVAPEVLFQVVQSTLGSDQLLSLVSCVGLGLPNKNHRAIASLAAMGSVVAIVTTNFDCYIEQCLNDLRVKFVAIPDENSAEAWSIHAGKGGDIPVLKIHGSLEKPSSIIATVKAAGRTLSPFKAKLLRHLLKERQILLTGYSGNDYDVFPELLGAVVSSVPRHVFVSAFSSIEWPITELVAACEKVTAIPNTSAEVVLSRICKQGGALEASGPETARDSWRRYIDGVVDSIPVIDLIVFLGQLSLLLGDFETARKPFFIIARDLYQQYLAKERCVANVRRGARIHSALMACYVRLGLTGRIDRQIAADMARDELEQARRLFCELREEYRSDDEMELWWCQLNGRAWLSLCARQLDDAENLFRNSIICVNEPHTDAARLFLQGIGDEVAVDAYIGLGDTLAAKGNLSEALSAYQRALELSQAFGSLWLAARAHGALAKLTETEMGHQHHIADAKRMLAFMGLQIDELPQHNEYNS